MFASGPTSVAGFEESAAHVLNRVRGADAVLRALSEVPASEAIEYATLGQTDGFGRVVCGCRSANEPFHADGD